MSDLNGLALNHAGFQSLARIGLTPEELRDRLAQLGQDDAEVAHGIEDEGEQWEFRVLVFREHVTGIGGQIGIVARTVLRSYDDFCEAVQRGGTTAGEETRLYAVVDETMQLVESLRAGEQ